MCNRYRYYIVAAFVVIATACSHKHPELPSIKQQGPSLITSTRQYAYNYGDTVGDSANDIYVICRDCINTPLAKVMQRPNVGIRLAGNSVAAIRNPTLSVVSSPLSRLSPTITPPIPNSAQTSTGHATTGAPPKKAIIVRSDENECILATVHFDFNKDSLRKSDLMTLNKVVDRLKGLANSGVTVQGHTCDNGPQNYNDQLAIRRAKSVGDYLLSNGVKTVTLSGKGKCCYISDDPKINRRAVITVDNSDAAIPREFCAPRVSRN